MGRPCPQVSLYELLPDLKPSDLTFCADSSPNASYTATSISLSICQMTDYVLQYVSTERLLLTCSDHLVQVPNRYLLHINANGGSITERVQVQLHPLAARLGRHNQRRLSGQIRLRQGSCGLRYVSRSLNSLRKDSVQIHAPWDSPPDSLT